MAELEVRPDISRMLVEAKHHNAVPQMVNLSAMMSASKQVLIRPRLNGPNDAENMRNMEKARNQNTLRIPGSDILTHLNVWKAWVDSNYSYAFANEHLLNTKALNEVGLIRGQLLRTLGQAGISDVGEEVSTNTIMKCVLAGVPSSLFFGDDMKRFYNPINDDPFTRGIQISPGSSVFKRGAKVISALNIRKSDKLVEDRFSGRQEKKSTLYAWVCHNLSYDDIREIFGDAAVEEIPEGAPRASPYGDYVNQYYKIRVLGKDIGFETRKVTALELAIPKVLYEIHDRNHFIMERYNDLLLRKGSRKVDGATLTEFYKEIIKRLGIIDQEGVEEHKDAFKISLDDFISKEEQESIERDSPLEIFIKGERLPVLYRSGTYFGDSATAEIRIPSEDVLNVIEHEIMPSFPRMKHVTFSYQMREFSSLLEVRAYIEREKRWAREAEPSTFSKITTGILLSAK